MWQLRQRGYQARSVYDVTMLNKGLELTKCEEAKEIFKEIIEHYRFEDRS